MRQRCCDENNEEYGSYGRRGICVCPEWEDFAVFAKWAYQNGYDDNAKYGECTLERKNVDGNYEPQNCCFTSLKLQQRNKVATKYIEYNGKLVTIPELVDLSGMDYMVIYARLKGGWTVERAITTPVQKRR